MFFDENQEINQSYTRLDDLVVNRLKTNQM